MGPQSRKSPNYENFRSFETKCHLDVIFVERHKKYYKGEGGGFPFIILVYMFGLCKFM
jgi:hypothetical protein